MQAEENKIIEFTLLFNKYKRRVYSYSLKMLGDKMRADDVVQDVFIKLFENLNTIQNKQSVHFWIFKTARNEILSFYRSTKNKKLITSSVDLNDEEIENPLLLADEIENKELNKLILAELDLMNEDFKRSICVKRVFGI